MTATETPADETPEVAAEKAEADEVKAADEAQAEDKA